jgi:CDP-paratose 2-epimerase
VIPRPVLITGGAGFVGCNLADRLVREGRSVVVYDNLARPGTERNARWLQDTHGDRVQLVVGDVRDARALRPFVRRASGVVHLAAQVAVTSSLADPSHDFDVNARGTFTVLELLRGLADPPPLIFTSTNKVYGGLDDVLLREEKTRYVPVSRSLRARGVNESRPLDFQSPYGCSKGTADQYVLDYARSWSLPAVVFRMSCIYGPHQCGNEDQGWVCHFLRSAIDGLPLTIYGDGKQVRDLLYVDDLCEAFLRVLRGPEALVGRPYNLGGGPDKSLSLLELLSAIELLLGRRPFVRFAGWRRGDQRYYVSDTARFSAGGRWTSRVHPHEGLERLYRWLLLNGRPRLPLRRRRTS